jgi:hypothetical protein
MIHITRHAIARYQERVAPCSSTEVRERILTHASALAVAIAFGAPVVRCADGVRFVLDKGSVVTVLGPGMRSNARLAA